MNEFEMAVADGVDAGDSSVSWRTRPALRASDLECCRRLRVASAMAHRLPNPRDTLQTGGYRHLLVVDGVHRRPLATLGWRWGPAVGSMQAPCPLDAQFVLSSLLRVGQRCVEVDGPYLAEAGMSASKTLAIALRGLARHEPATRTVAMGVRLRFSLFGSERYVQSLSGWLEQVPGLFTPDARPRVPLPRSALHEANEVMLPARLQAWLQVGARLVSAPAWDAEAGLAVFLLWRQPRRERPARLSFQASQSLPQALELFQ